MKRAALEEEEEEETEEVLRAQLRKPAWGGGGRDPLGDHQARPSGLCRGWETKGRGNQLYKAKREKSGLQNPREVYLLFKVVESSRKEKPIDWFQLQVCLFFNFCQSY